ncbi:hypothetical protein [Nocardia farcinica]|uniref:Uncharacterized protein n=1 Tax=Nocardia farcinica (strain IFM 10152) TaxID=247156 RepID=Q5YMQ3_NOCFA|nr:hypothetical protein [Nocardia farcinica]MBF6410871.1 hypothetical protein [Nocardia farcinica]UEX26019.1 hypothetical protein LMJ57_29675 [Nocardia farcinica]BAD60538.1 hypothetical protein PNF1_130 [Nocardia farcinica IFM 10152]
MTASYTADELRTLLETGAAAADSRYQRAAIHLLNFTELPGRTALNAYIETDTVTIDGRDVRAAWIRDWDGMGRLENLGYLSGGEERLVRRAASMAHGSPVDLCATLSSLGHAHARRVLEAVAICLGADEYYDITPTPALLENQRFEEQLLAGELSRRGLGPDGQPVPNPQSGETE